MTLVDAVNGTYELGGGIVILLLNIRRTYRDKSVRGVNPWATGFFASWGYWNCIFYPAVDAWFSFAGALFLAGMNTIWFLMLLYYSRDDHAFDEQFETEHFRYDSATQILEMK